MMVIKFSDYLRSRKENTNLFELYTYVLLKTPPTELPINKQNCWEKNTQVIWLSVEFVWHCKSKIVGPRKAMHSPKLKKTLQ